jgi:hypothetical protein
MTTAADYTEKIPTNVDLREDRRLRRVLESWPPNFLSWWQTIGPMLPTQAVYLRIAVHVGLTPPRNGINRQPFDHDYVRLPLNRVTCQ